MVVRRWGELVDDDDPQSYEVDMAVLATLCGQKLAGLLAQMQGEIGPCVMAALNRARGRID